MHSILYLILVVVLLLIIYILVNYITILIFNKGKREFLLKPESKFRLEKNYVYGNKLDNLHNGDLNCTTQDEKLIECDIDENNALGKNGMCAQCKQISAICINIREAVYSSTDHDRVIISPNSSPNKGYCLPAVLVSKSCTRRNGGKWILTTSSSNSSDSDVENKKYLVYTFECFCSTPNFFQNDYFGGNDCTRFVGCLNGKLKNNDWNSYEDMRCTCNENVYEEQLGSENEPPKCIPLNIYRRKYDGTIPLPFDILDRQYIDPGYLFLLGNNNNNTLNLPNPCTFDVATRTFIKDIGKVVWDSTKKIAYCVLLM